MGQVKWMGRKLNTDSLLTDSSSAEYLFTKKIPILNKLTPTGSQERRL